MARTRTKTGAQRDVSQATPIVLEPADYWQLAALERDVQLAQQAAAQHVAKVVARHTTCLRALAEKYPDLQADDARYTADDATCSLTVEPKKD